MDSTRGRIVGISRRSLLALPLLAAAPLSARPLHATEPAMGDDGLYKQDWFVQSFLELAEDLAEATAKKKRLVLLWEQRGCPYCFDLHRINLADAKTAAYIKERFAVIQLNLWGDREITDFDGEKLREKDFARKYRINFTPTLQFFPETVDEMKGKKGADAEVARMPGYFRPFHFISMFEYVHEKRYAHQDFQRYIVEKSASRREGGEKKN
jgi:thioredoxin-related protein